jgi:hypothetical protein
LSTSILSYFPYDMSNPNRADCEILVEYIFCSIVI